MVVYDWEKTESIKTALLKMARLSERKLIGMGQTSKSKADKLFSEEKILNDWINIIEG